MTILSMKQDVDRPHVRAETNGNRADKQELRERLLKLIVKSEAERRTPKKPA